MYSCYEHNCKFHISEKIAQVLRNELLLLQSRPFYGILSNCLVISIRQNLRYTDIYIGTFKSIVPLFRNGFNLFIHNKMFEFVCDKNRIRQMWPRTTNDNECHRVITYVFDIEKLSQQSLEGGCKKTVVKKAPPRDNKREILKLFLFCDSARKKSFVLSCLRYCFYSKVFLQLSR